MRVAAGVGWKEWRGLDDAQASALAEAINDEAESRARLVAKIVASIRATATGKLDEREVLREMGVGP